MRILLTNDDGISSPHLQAFADRLNRDHDVWVFAPDKEQSACSHSITLMGPLIVEEKAEKQYACSGTPADCVLLALQGYINKEFDLVISGINKGPNLGTDIVYSGTAAGARQGAIMGKPAFAVSTNSKDTLADISYQIEFLCHNMENLNSIWKTGCFININFPQICSNKTQVELTFPCNRVYNDKLTRFSAPDGKTYCFFNGEIASAKEKGSDYYAVEAQNISISLISVHPTHIDVSELFHTLSFRKGENA